MVIKLAGRAAHIEFGEVAGANIDVERTADPFAGDVIVAILHFFGINNAAGLVPPTGFDIVGFKFAFVIGNAARNADVLTQFGGEVDAALGRYRIGIVIKASLCLNGQQVLFAVKGAGRADFNRAANGVAIHIRGVGFLNLNRFDAVRADDVQRDRAYVAFRCGQADAVQRAAVEFGVKAADGDETPFALVVQDVDAGQAADGFGDVLVGELPDGVAGQDAGHAIGLPLTGKGAVEAGRLSNNKNLAGIGTAQGGVGNDAAGFGHRHGLRHRFSA